MTLVIGSTAPDFEIKTADNETFKLSDHRGKKVIIYFYPKDSTPGCTIESCAFRDAHPDFTKANAVILGISKDSLKSHAKFKEKHQFPFDLGSDEDGAVCTAYGTFVEKSMFGKKYMGIERSTFLIDENGKITGLWRKVKVKGHVQDVLNSL